MQIKKEEVKFPLFADYMCLSIENLEEPVKKNGLSTCKTSGALQALV